VITPIRDKVVDSLERQANSQVAELVKLAVVNPLRLEYRFESCPDYIEIQVRNHENGLELPNGKRVSY